MKGTAYNAAEFRIEAGPEAKTDYPGQLKGLPGEGRVPVLAGWKDPVYVVLDPSTLPIGHKVKVKGVLGRYHLFRDSGEDVSRQMYLGYDRGGNEQILYVQGAIQVID